MTKEELKEYISIKKEAEQIRLEIEDLYHMLKSPVITGMPSAHSPDADKIGNVIAKIEELEAKYMAKLNLLIQKQNDIENVISKLDSKERTLMRYRYIDGHDWERICVDMNYSWKQTHRIHSNILNKIKDDTQ